jgi:hypothetical protein
VEYTFRKDIIRFEGIVAICNRDHETEMAHMAKMKPLISETEYHEMEKNLRRLMIRVEDTRSRLNISNNMCWWILQNLRACYRRSSLIEGNVFFFF